MKNPRTLLTVSIAMIFVIAIILYSVYQSRFLILGPEISIEYPQDGVTLSSPLLVVKGTIKNASFIYLNDKQIFVNKEMIFQELLQAHEGYNILTIRALDNFGRTRIETREYVLKLTETATTSLLKN